MVIPIWLSLQFNITFYLVCILSIKSIGSRLRSNQSHNKHKYHVNYSKQWHSDNPTHIKKNYYASDNRPPSSKIPYSTTKKFLLLANTNKKERKNIDINKYGSKNKVKKMNDYELSLSSTTEEE